MKTTTLLFLSLMIGVVGFSQKSSKKGVILRTNKELHENPLPHHHTLSADDCGQETLSNDFETSLGSLKNYIIANDFVVSEEMGVFSLESITFHAFVEPGGDVNTVDFTFYDDSGSGPGDIKYSLEDVNPTSVEVIGEYEDDDGPQDVLKVSVELEDPITFEGDADDSVYWMGVQVPNYEGSDISFELISSLDTPHGTYAFLAGGWQDIEDLFGVIRDGVMTLAGTCENAEECSEVHVDSLEGPESVCATEEFMITPVGVTTGVSGVSFTWEKSPVGQDNWSIIQDATSLNLIMDSGIDEPTQFRFTITCESGNSATTEPFEVTLNSAEDCYCEPEYNLGCEDGDAINKVKIENDHGEVVFQHESDCGQMGYSDFTEDIDAPELRQGQTYKMTMTTNSEDAVEEDMNVWIDFNQNGVFEEDESIGGSDGEGLDENGEYSFEFTIPEDLALDTYRLRARMVWLGGADINPCDKKSFGEAEDYAIRIIEELGFEETVFNEFRFYPNPVKNKLNLTAKRPIQHLIIYNLHGQKVLQKSPEELTTELQTNNLASGIYLMTVKLDELQKTYRLIKQ